MLPCPSSKNVAQEKLSNKIDAKPIKETLGEMTKQLYGRRLGEADGGRDRDVLGKGITKSRAQVAGHGH